MITEVEITVGSELTRFSQYAPSQVDVGTWLAKIVHDLVIAPATERVVDLPGCSWQIDRKNMTSMTITWSQ